MPSMKIRCSMRIERRESYYKYIIGELRNYSTLQKQNDANEDQKRISNLLYDPFALAISSFHNFGSLSMSVMRWWSAAFLVGLDFFLGLDLTAVGLVFVLRFGVVGALVLFLGLFVAIASSVSLPPSCCSNNDTRSAFFPVVFSPLFASSSFNSTTFRDDQSFVGLFVARSLFRDDETLVSSASGMSLFVEACLAPRTGELRRVIKMGTLGITSNNVDCSNRCGAMCAFHGFLGFVLVETGENAPQKMPAFER